MTTMSPASLRTRITRHDLLMTCCLVLLTASPLHAAILHVGPDQPYTTIQSAITAANPNDTIAIHAGTYTEQVSITKDGLTLTKNQSDTPVLVGNMLIQSRQNITISGLRVTGWTQSQGWGNGITITNSDAITITQNIVHNGAGSCIYARNSTRITIRDNETYGCQKGINIVSGHSTDASYQNGILISRNTIHDNPIDGIDIHGQYITVEQNVVYDNIDPNWQTTHPDGIQIIASGIPVDGYDSAQHVHIRFNTFRNHTQNIFLQGASLSAANCEDIHVYGNVVYNESATVHGVNMDSLAATNIVVMSARNVYLYNNTVGRTGSSGMSIRNSADGTIYLKNNIINNSLMLGVYVEDPNDIAPGGMDYNLYDNGGYAIKYGSSWYKTASEFSKAYPHESHGKDAAPRINPWPNVTLLSDSPAIDTGIALDQTYARDKAGSLRSGQWDIGAYEYLVNAPNPPQNLTIQ